MGFHELELPELYGMTASALRQELDKADLRCTSIVFPYDRFANDLNGTVQDAKTLGAEYVVIGWIPHNGTFSPEDVTRATHDFNAWGKALSEQGIKFDYHPHGYEFQPAVEGTLFDRMVHNTDSRFVNFEMDVFWIVHPGQDPVALMRKYPTRFPLMHLKDLRKGEPTGVLTGSAPEESSVALGQGQLDFPAILREAKRIGVKRYYLEDEAPNAAEQLQQSLHYLDSLSSGISERPERSDR